MNVDAPRHVEVHELPAEVLRAEDQSRRHDPILQDFLAVIDVVEEQVERMEALDEPGLDAAPLGVGDDPRDEIEREDPLRALGVVVNGEGDAAAQEGGIDRRPSLVEFRSRQAFETLGEPAVMRTDGGRAARREHLVEEVFSFVAGAQQGHGGRRVSSPSLAGPLPAWRRSWPPRVRPSYSRTSRAGAEPAPASSPFSTRVRPLSGSLTRTVYFPGVKTWGRKLPLFGRSR